LTITRREFCAGAAVVGVGSAFVAWATPFAGFFSAAEAQTPSQADLLQPGPLPDMVLGAADAPVTIIEYASLTCPHCRHFEVTTFPELKKRYIDTGKVRYIFREFVLNDLDALAILLARCTDKDKYFPFVETLYETQEQWVVRNAIPALMGIAKQVGFTEESFNKCAANQPLLDSVKAQRDRAADKFGVSSTPTFFINGKIYSGSMSIEDMEKLIQPYLKG
jgi:protein-disulfide isomerase